MRFAGKMTLVISAFLCAALSLGGSWTIQQNFSRVRRELLRQNSRRQLYDRYALETALAQEQTGRDVFDQAARYAAEQRALTTEEAPSFAVFGTNGTVLYSDLPHSISYTDQQEAVAAGETEARFLRTEGQVYLLLSTPLRGLERSLWLVSAYDVTPQFQERDRQVVQHLFLQVAALILTGTAATLASRRMTRPLHQLEKASFSLAEGKTGVRVNISSRDELEQLGDTFNRMAGALEDQMALLRQETDRQKRFVAAFTHELKTPMTAILGYSGMLRSAELPVERRRKAADYIYHESSRLEALCRELLLLLGLEKGQLSLELVAVSLVYGDVRRSMPDFPLHLELHDEQKAVVWADRVLLTTLLRNLILNAAAAEPRDNTVMVHCGRCEGGIRLCVEDHGRGIPPEDLSRITEPFYRVDKSRSRDRGGNGLGLSICAMIAECHGSTLELDSREGEGTRVCITLKEAES